MPAAEPREAPAPAADVEPEAEAEEAVEEAVGGATEDWKPAYDAKLAEWREEADVAREKAAATRAAIEAEHAAVAKAKADAEKAQANAIKEEKERAEREVRLAKALADDNASAAGRLHPSTSSFAAVASSTAEDRNAKVRDAWQLVKGKDQPAASGPSKTEPSTSVPSAAASQWEEISAPHSSVEDIGSVSATASSPSTSQRSPPEEKEKATASAPSSPPAPKDVALAPAPAAAGEPITTPSLTLSLFTRPGGLTVSRVVAALGINLVLPFINGIMLGLGEITAREAVRVGRLWWRGERAVMGFWHRKTGGASNVSGVGLSGSGGF